MDMAKAVGIIVVVLLATSIPATLIAQAIADGEEIKRDAAALTFALGAGVFLELALLGTALHFSVRKYGAPLAALGLKWPDRGGFWSTLGLGVGMVIAALAINFAYFLALDALGVRPDTEFKEAFERAGPLIALTILSLLFAPLMEELFFRSFIFGGLRGRWGFQWAAIGSGFLFALAHIGNPGTIYLIPPITAIGAMFAWGYSYSGSILAVLLAHFLINLLAVGGGVAQYS
jgi:membrane protease YdiL (CAAX protease family)